MNAMAREMRHLPRSFDPADLARIEPCDDPKVVPESEAELLACLASWRWRMFSGQLYKIIAKVNPDGQPSLVIPFIPNPVQRHFLSGLHTRNVVLKARQLGCTTAISLTWTDHALFNADQRCAIIAHRLPDAESIFRDKVRFAYDGLPEPLREAMPLKRDSQTELLFAHNNSAVKVATSSRSGTINRLHISEMGKIAAQFPGKAREIVTGSFPSVPEDGIIIVESTAEGLGGAFYDLSNAAETRCQIDRPLAKSEWKFHFYPWMRDPAYRADPKMIRISPSDHLYFDTIEAEIDAPIDLDQRAWYVAKRESEFASDPDLMFREYPSTPKEAWRASTDGKYLAHVLALARKEGRIGSYPLLRHIPVNTFWDLGASDDTTCWLHQRVQGMDRWVGYREASGEGYLPFIIWLENLGCTFGTHFLPHDAANKRQTETIVTTPIQQLREMKPSWDWQIVPRVLTIQHGIDLMRQDFQTYVFDEEACKQGLSHLEAYSREWNTRLDTWADYPRHDEHSHAADALRQKAQGYRPGATIKPTKRTGARARGMTA